MKFATLQRGLFISLVVIATALFVWLVKDYLQPIFWAVVLAVLFFPVYTRILEHTKQRRIISVLLTMLLIVLVVVVPVYFIGVLVAQEAINLYYAVTVNDSGGFDLGEQLESAAEVLGSFGVDAAFVQEKLTGLIESVSAQVGVYALEAGRATASTIFGVFLTLYLLFFALRDGQQISQRIIHALPLGDTKEKMLFNQFASIIRAMLKGTFIIAIIQGAIGGILFAVVGVQSAVLWATVMALFALIPAVGPAIVWVPVGILLLLTGNVWQGVMVLLVGAFVIGLVDNILRPVLVGRDTAMPDALVLLSVLGGLTLFGLAGIIIGPTITAFFLSMWKLFEHDYAKELKEQG